MSPPPAQQDRGCRRGLQRRDRVEHDVWELHHQREPGEHCRMHAIVRGPDDHVRHMIATQHVERRVGASLRGAVEAVHIAQAIVPADR